MKKNRLTIIIIISIIIVISVMTAGLMFSKMVYNNKNELNVKKRINTIANKKNIEDGKKAQQEAKSEIDREQKLKDFADKYKDNSNYNKSFVNSTPERRTKNGEFYVDNAGDLYSEKIVDIDDMGRIEDRLKEAANDMKTVYSEANSFEDDYENLNGYFSKGDNKSRFNYLYGISSTNDLKSFVSKLAFLKDSKVKYGILENIKKVDDSNINFQFEVKANNSTSQMFNVSINFADERAILNIRIS